MGLVQTSLVNGNGTIRDNLYDATKIVPLQNDGYFAQAFDRNLRIFKSANPLKDAHSFFTRLSFGQAACKSPHSKGTVAYMSDGAIISLQIYSVDNNLIVIEVAIEGLWGVKNQRIYFMDPRIDEESLMRIIRTLYNAF